VVTGAPGSSTLLEARVDVVGTLGKEVARTLDPVGALGGLREELVDLVVVKLLLVEGRGHRDNVEHLVVLELLGDVPLDLPEYGRVQAFHGQLAHSEHEVGSPWAFSP